MSDDEKNEPKPPIEVPDLSKVEQPTPEKKRDYTHTADHLKAHQFQKGKSGNPGGRPKKVITENYVWAAKQKVPDETVLKLGLRKGTTWGQVAALGMFKKMAEGDPMAAKEIRESIQGKLEDKPLLPELGRVAVDLNVNVHEQLKSATARLRDRLAKQESIQ
jgi:hypothetical protein